MNKEQFLAMSLPHGLKGYVDGKGTISGQNIYILFNCLYMAATVEVMSTIAGESDFYTDKSKFKPILHHLSYLTKDEWIDKLNTFACELLDAAHVYDEKNIVGINWMLQPFEIVMWLIKNHFNLMDESESFIDVNTLEINPYK